ncbi:MAG: LuxR C-terminal-related transcriptional regulator [Sporichthyaceae bacterium]
MGSIRTAVAAGGVEPALRAFDGFLDALEYAAAAARTGAPVGVHTGADSEALAARIGQLAHPGQVLLSETSAALAVALADPRWEVAGLGPHRLRDLLGVQEVGELRPVGALAGPAPRSMDVLPHSLPSVRTSFLGRDGDVAEVATHLRDSRLVAVVGPPGVGKTRLGLHVAAEVLGEYAGGAWFADLTPIAAPELVPAAVAAGVRVAEVPGRDLVDTVAEHVGRRPTLLVLDNCEHLLAAAADAAGRLLEQCPGLRVLALSREPLRHGDEVVVRLPPLEPAPAAALFAERAAAAGPVSFGEADLAAIADICTEVDGLPLAIELAAARCRFLTPRQLADQFQDRARLLAGGAAPAERQRSVEASISWSVGLLDAAGRTLLRRLAVFAGGFDLHAAERVCSDDLLAVRDVLDALAGLVDHSLVHSVPASPGAPPRFRLLVSIREHALGLLASAGEEQTLRRRHAEFYVEFVRTLAPRFLGPDRIAARDLLNLEIDNVRVADDWAVTAGQTDLAQGLLLREYWFQEHPAEGWMRSYRAATLPGGSGVHRATACSVAVECAWAMEEWERGLEVLDHGIAESAASGNAAVECELLSARGWLEVFGGEPQALSTLTRAAELGRVGGAAFWTGDALLGRGLLHFFDGDGAASRAAYAEAEALAIAQPSVMTHRLGGVLGHHDMFAGDLDGAWRRFAAAYEGSVVLADPALRGIFEGGLAWVSGLRGEFAAACTVAQRAHADAEAARQAFAAAWALLSWVVLAGRAGQDEVLSADTEEAFAAGGMPFMAAWAMALRAESLLRSGDLDAAGEIAAAALTAAEAPYCGRALGPAALAAARVARARGFALEAEREAHRALAAARRACDDLETVAVLECLGGLAVELGAAAEGARLLAAAGAAREAFGLPVPPTAADALTADLTAAREALGDRFEAEWTAGAALSIAEAVDYCTRGRGPRRRPAAGWESLTPTELEVVRLCAAGKRNQEIADALFVSVPTVKTHLRRIFAKLDVTSRAQLAALVARRT